MVVVLLGEVMGEWLAGATVPPQYTSRQTDHPPLQEAIGSSQLPLQSLDTGGLSEVCASAPAQGLRFGLQWAQRALAPELFQRCPFMAIVFQSA